MPHPDKRVHARKTQAVAGVNVVVGGVRTSLRLEKPLQDALQEIAQIEGLSVNQVITAIDLGLADASDARSRSSAVRVFIADYFRAAATREGHERAGHGKGKLLGGYSQSRPVTNRSAAM